ncbi:hypothetical protein DL96DRAFT_1716008 [Flagelloscypha sp. PMI_526]|nr:hypothetical protein DL96DRAFT_1716008 [Flagelloscypha sp. PMI_526]
MSTPRAGTLHQSDIETLHRPYKSPYKGWVQEYLVPFLWVNLYTTASSCYNVGACALGRFMLDHFHLWKQTIPLHTSGVSRHAELIAASSTQETRSKISTLEPLLYIDMGFCHRELGFSGLGRSDVSSQIPPCQCCFHVGNLWVWQSPPFADTLPFEILDI